MPNKENYLDKAEKIIGDLQNSKNPKTGKPIAIVTTSKIRNLLSMSADIYNEVRLFRGTELDEAIKERIAYLRLRCLYEAGREESVRLFANVKTKADYLEFSHYMEALVAWRKFLCGRDD